ncbi:signal peptidase II [bacterium]|nr:signal peptidase II [bacterium]
MRKLQRIAILLFVMLVSVGCDQATKSVAQNTLAGTEPIIFLNGMVRLQYAENPGAFLSLGAGLSSEARYWIFVVLAALILGGLILYMFRVSLKMHIMSLVGLALFAGGGLGNLIDRITNDGRVIDFMNVGIGPLRTGIFNVADMALMAGIGLLAVFELRKGTGDQGLGTEDRRC